MIFGELGVPNLRKTPCTKTFGSFGVDGVAALRLPCRRDFSTSLTCRWFAQTVSSVFGGLNSGKLCRSAERFLSCLGFGIFWLCARQIYALEQKVLTISFSTMHVPVIFNHSSTPRRAPAKSMVECLAFVYWWGPNLKVSILDLGL